MTALRGDTPKHKDTVKKYVLNYKVSIKREELFVFFSFRIFTPVLTKKRQKKGRATKVTLLAIRVHLHNRI